MISVSQSQYITKSPSVRLDGRKPLQHRQSFITPSILKSSSGSCLFSSPTKVLTSIKLGFDVVSRIETLVEWKMPKEYRLSIEQDFKSVVISWLEQNESLRISDKWGLVVTITCLIQAHKGNVLDALFHSTLFALCDCRLPKFEVDEIGEFEVVGDLDESSELIKQSDIPGVLTLYKVGKTCMADPTFEEELCAQARVTVSFLASGEISSVRKGGPGSVEPSFLMEMIHTAKKQFKKVQEAFVNALQREVDATDINQIENFQ